jgi:hypothetical protein
MIKKEALMSVGRTIANTVVAVATLALGGALLSRADYNFTQGTGSVMFAFTCFTTKICPVHTNVTSAGVEISSYNANSITSLATSLVDNTGTQLGGLSVGTFGAPSTQVLSIQNNDPCSYAAKSSTPITLTTATTQQLIPVSGSTVPYVCGFSMTIAPSATSAATALFEYGTSTNCTGTNALTGTYGNGDLTSAAPVAPITAGNASSTVFKGAAASGICIVTAGTAVNVQGVLTYVQQ